jgi:hypothetical protein
VIPKRYLIATLFIAAMLVILAVVQAPRSRKEGGVMITTDSAVGLTLESFETLAQFELQEGWVPRFVGALDPDQPDPWPFSAGFNTPWEPASPYLRDQGLALNGPEGTSEVVLWRGLEWRHYRFDAPLCSARLDPDKGNHLLVTLRLGPTTFETQLLEVPEGRVLWASDSGPWSRFSWDGKAVLLGLAAPMPGSALLLATRPTDKEQTESTLASWAEKNLPAPPKGWITKPDELWDDGKDLPGERLLVPWQPTDKLWFPAWNRLWISDAGGWTLWGLEDATWRRMDAGPGVLAAHPPLAMGRFSLDKNGFFVRQISPLDTAFWRPVPAEEGPWPAYDPAWIWHSGSALDAWDRRWGPDLPELAPEREREALRRSYTPEWRVASGLRASVLGWLPSGPEVTLREAQAKAWVWVGNRVLMVKLRPVDRLRQIKSMLKGF